MNEYDTTNYVWSEPMEPQVPTEFERNLPPVEWPRTEADHAVNEAMWVRQAIHNYYNW